MGGGVAKLGRETCKLRHWFLRPDNSCESLERPELHTEARINVRNTFEEYMEAIKGEEGPEQ